MASVMTTAPPPQGVSGGDRTALPASPTAIEPVMQAYEAGFAALLLSGRSLYDLATDEGSRVLTLLELLRREARARHGLLLVTYSLAAGLDWDAPRLEDQRDARTVEMALRAHGLTETRPGTSDVVRVIRGIAALVRTPTTGLAWANGRPMHFLFLLEFAEHLLPCGEAIGRTDAEITAVELAHILGQSNALRRSGNLVAFHSVGGSIDPLVSAALHPVRLAQPDAAEKEVFLRALEGLYPAAQFETGLGRAEVARLTSNTPNRGLEVLVRASHRRRTPLGMEALIDQKSRDVREISEHTLTSLDTRRVDAVALVGRTIEAPLALLRSFGAGLLRGSPHVPANVLLVGPPGSGKTDVALLAAREARSSAYAVHSPKGGIVGETERRSRLLTTALAEWTPNVAFIDEITEAMPLERSAFDGDSGASRAVMAALLTALSDESRRGRSLLVATTNCPQRMGAAMRSRFTVIPVLAPVHEDFPAIVHAVAARIAPGAALDEDAVCQAGEVFYTKGASPREIRAALDFAVHDMGGLSGPAVLAAAHEVCPLASRGAAEYADLWAVKACTSARYFPWYRDPAGFPFPAHLAGLVHPTTGEVDRVQLDARIRDREPLANV